ncbi:hypothetical protein DRQ00_02740 [candidate division KSB1 bacterium]|nr:MAG: hypothetical protein DRQ00_02740 [candidate division KSB1 bacterium]RKY80548.1 MAG: hypothetical protein DRQ12_00850 [candidate division KSB1 bacterium]
MRVKKVVKNTLIYWFVFYSFIFIRLISRRRALQVLENLGRLTYYLVPSVRRSIIKHLEIAFGQEKTEAEIRQMAKQVLVDLGRNAVDAIRLPIYSREQIEQIVKIEGKENIDQALQKRHGVLLVTGHIGNWELMAATIAMQGYPLYVIGATLYDKRLDRIVVNNRMRAGYYNIPRGNSAKKILKTLRQNAILGILIDQDTRVDGVYVDFFGRPAHTPIGPVVLALKTKAPIVPLAIQMQPDYTHCIRIEKEVPLEVTGNRQHDLEVNTQRITTILENFIRRHPTQWVWMHERWKKQPAEERR